MSLVSISNRLASLVAQLFLGRLLFEQDFGLYALALSFTTVGDSIRGVLQPVLIEHCQKNQAAFDRLYRTIMASMWLFVAAMVMLSGTVAGLTNEPDVRLLLVAMLLVLPLRTLPVFGIARCNHRLDFQRVSAALALGGIMRYLVTVGFAFAGLGPYSFVLGFIGAQLTELFVLRADLRVTPGLLSKQTIADIRGSLDRFRLSPAGRRWIWPSAIALSLSTTGDYLAASINIGAALLGLYFFAYTLIGSFYQPLGLAINTVLVPGFVRIESRERRRQRFLEIAGTVSVLGVLIFNTTAVSVGLAAHLLWGGRWDAAIPAMVGFAIFAPLHILQPTSLAVARGSGHWNLYFTSILTAGTATVVGATIGSMIGGLVALVTAVGVANGGAALLSLLRLARRLGADPLNALRQVVVPWLAGLIAVGAAHLISPLDRPDPAASALAAACFAGLAFLLVVIPFRQKLLNLMQSLRGAN